MKEAIYKVILKKKPGKVMAKEKKYPKAIYNWPEDERPRERLLKFRTDKLSYFSFFNEGLIKEE